MLLVSVGKPECESSDNNYDMANEAQQERPKYSPINKEDKMRF